LPLHWSDVETGGAKEKNLREGVSPVLGRRDFNWQTITRWAQTKSGSDDV